nr:protein kinase [Gemmatimonadaceae bacterium]
MITNGATPQSQWPAVEELFHQALERDPGDRPAFLQASCPAPLRGEVEALLSAHDGHGALDVLAEGVMAPLLKDRRGGAAPSATSTAQAPALDRYEIIERLGGGGMGIVYRARDTRLERQVALKFLPPHLSMDEASKKRFLVEARAAASLEHPNICTVHEIGETPDGQLYIVMGCYDGETVDRRIASGPLPVREAVSIAIDVARGLAKAHDRGIVHRDVKPANIMLTADGVVKILDFGIAKLSGMSVTQTVGVIGTLAYMSPEQAFGEAVDGRTDLWALGIVLHEMLTGGRPFRGPGQQAVLFSILTQELEPVAAVRPDVPPELDAVLRRALAKKPADRFATAAEMHAALAAVPLDAPQVPSPAPARPATPESVAAVTESLLTQAGERRHATIVVSNLCDYDQLVERLAPDALDAVMSAVRTAATGIASAHGGIVNHMAGAELVLMFGVLTSHEDDYLRAVRACMELHAWTRSHAPGTGADGHAIRLRSGVHTGVLVAQRQRSGDRRFRITGAPPEVATRLSAAADADVILVSPECHRLVDRFVDAVPMPDVAVHGGEVITPFRITEGREVHTRLEAAERAGLTPYAGRSRELQQLRDAAASAVHGAGGLAVVLGEAGSGKSRLLHELRRAIGEDVQLLLGRCDAYGGTTPYMPFVEVMRELLGLTSDAGAQAGSAAASASEADVAARVHAVDPALAEFLPLYCALLSVQAVKHPLPRHLQGEHLQAAMLEALSALVTLQARRRPTLLLLEDWHWADEASRAALTQLADVAAAHALLITVTSRPEAGIEWSTGENRLLLHLGPLTPQASAEMVQSVLGADRVAPELASLLHERTAGNAFFLEEMCTALLEEGRVVMHDGEAVATTAEAPLQLPETVQAVIRTRLDRLEPGARDVLRVASVIGREFPRGVLAELIGAAVDLARALDELRTAGLVQQTSVVPEPAFRFKHVLTQEVAYDTLLEHQRQTLHAAAARAIDGRYATRLEEHLERLAHHTSRAGEWAKAVRHAIGAADRSKSLSQFADALAMLDQAAEWVSHLPDGDAAREMHADILLRAERLCETLGNRARQMDLVEELITLLAPNGGSAQLAEAYLRQGDLFTLLRRFDAADRSLATSLRLSVELADKAGERNSYRSLGLLRSHSGRKEEAVASIKRALALDLELGELSAAAGDVASLGNMLRNMGSHAEALEALEEALEYITPGADPTKWCAVMTVIATVHRDLGDLDESLSYLERARDLAIERRLPIIVSFCMPGIAHILLNQGRVEESLATYREAAEFSRRARHADGLAQSQRALGEVLVGLERHAEAIPALREAATLFGRMEDPDTEAQIWPRLARAHEHCGSAAAGLEVWEQLRERCHGAGDPGGESL